MSDWYYADNNEQKGPINESELKANFATNKLPPDALVWKDGMDAWTPANQVAAFTFRQPPAPAKVQPPPAAISGSPASPSAAAASAPTKVVTNPAANNPESTQPLDMKDLVGTPEALEVTPEDAEKNKIFGILAYIGILFVVPLLAAKESPFAKYHANQGCVLFVATVAAFIVLTIGEYMPVIGTLFFFIHMLAYLGVLVFMVLGILNAANGKCVPLPLIGGVKLIK